MFLRQNNYSNVRKTIKLGSNSACKLSCIDVFKKHSVLTGCISNLNNVASKRTIHCSNKYSNNTSRTIINEDVSKDSPTYANKPPTDAKVVICGGGIMGAAVAYNLAILGLGPQTVLIEQER